MYSTSRTQVRERQDSEVATHDDPTHTNPLR